MNTLFTLTIFALVVCSYTAPTLELAADKNAISDLENAELQTQQNDKVQSQEKVDIKAEAVDRAFHVDNHSQEDAQQVVGLKKISHKALSNFKNRAKLYLKKKQLGPKLQADGTKLQDLLDVQAQEDGDEDIAAIEAMIKKDALAQWHHIKKTLNKVKSITKKGLNRGIQLASKYQPGGAMPVATSPAIQALLSKIDITQKLKALSSQAKS